VLLRATVFNNVILHCWYKIKHEYYHHFVYDFFPDGCDLYGFSFCR